MQWLVHTWSSKKLKDKRLYVKTRLRSNYPNSPVTETNKKNLILTLNQNCSVVQKDRTLNQRQKMRIKRKKYRPKREREMHMRKIQIRSLEELTQIIIIILLFLKVVKNRNMKGKWYGQKYLQSPILMFAMKMIIKMNK